MPPDTVVGSWEPEGAEKNSLPIHHKRLPSALFHWWGLGDSPPRELRACVDWWKIRADSTDSASHRESIPASSNQSPRALLCRPHTAHKEQRRVKARRTNNRALPAPESTQFLDAASQVAGLCSRAIETRRSRGQVRSQSRPLIGREANVMVYSRVGILKW